MLAKVAAYRIGNLSSSYFSTMNLQSIYRPRYITDRSTGTRDILYETIHNKMLIRKGFEVLKAGESRLLELQYGMNNNGPMNS